MCDFNFFKDKVLCAINQIEHMGKKVSTIAYFITTNEQGIWIHRPNTFKLHPLSIFLIGRRKFKGELKAEAIARRFDLNVECIVAFNRGFSGSDYAFSKESKYYRLGVLMREKVLNKSKRTDTWMW